LDSNERVVQPAEMRHSPNGAGALYGAPERRILAQREVRSNGVVVGGIGAQRAAQMHRVHDDQMIDALAANGSDQSLDIRILPRTARSNRSVSDAHCLDAALEYLAIGSVAIANEIARR
jgi:hypothetical protein